MNRREFLTTTAIAGTSVALAACSAFTVTKTGSVTTITVNVKQIDAWGSALVNGALLVASLPGVANAPAAILIDGILAAIKTDLAAFDNASNGSVTLTFDQSSIPAALTSLLADGEALVKDAASIAGATAMSQTLQTYISAVQTIVSLLAAVIQKPTTVGAVRMTEAQALSILRR